MRMQRQLPRSGQIVIAKAKLLGAPKLMKTIEVVSAIIISKGLIFVTQRGYGDFKDQWEFPGGKIEPNESREDAIIREIKEELDASIEIVCYLNSIEYTYPAFHLKMHNFICRLAADRIALLEHEAARFVSPEELDTIPFLPADRLILPDLAKWLSMPLNNLP